MEEKQEKYELIITSEIVKSTDEHFTMENLKLGENYKPLDAYFKDVAGNEIRYQLKYYTGPKKLLGLAKKIQIKLCHSLLVKYLRNKLPHYLLKKKNFSRSANIVQQAK